MTQDVVIVGGARTPMAEYSGTPGHGKLKKISAIDLAAHSSKAALERAKIDPESVDHTVIGNALQTSNDAIYGARHVALKAGVPIRVLLLHDLEASSPSPPSWSPTTLTLALAATATAGSSTTTGAMTRTRRMSSSSGLSSKRPGGCAYRPRAGRPFG